MSRIQVSTGAHEISPQKKPINRKESTALLHYALSTTVPHATITPDILRRYEQAMLSLKIDPTHALSASMVQSTLLLGGIDTISRLLWPQCVLQQKLLIAAAIAETDPLSSNALLPRDHHRLLCLMHVLWLMLRAGAKLVIGIFLLLFLKSLKRNAGC